MQYLLVQLCPTLLPWALFIGPLVSPPVTSALAFHTCVQSLLPEPRDFVATLSPVPPTPQMAPLPRVLEKNLGVADLVVSSGHTPEAASRHSSSFCGHRTGYSVSVDFFVLLCFPQMFSRKNCLLLNIKHGRLWPK